MDGHFYRFAQFAEESPVPRGAVVLLRLGLPPDTLKVKRVLAIPGDRIAAMGLWEPERGEPTDDGLIPPGRYYIGNDNEAVSGLTSRERGLIPREWIRAMWLPDSLAARARST